jgi:hypothetical protein
MKPPKLKPKLDKRFRKARFELQKLNHCVKESTTKGNCYPNDALPGTFIIAKEFIKDWYRSTKVPVPTMSLMSGETVDLIHDVDGDFIHLQIREEYFVSYLIAMKGSPMTEGACEYNVGNIPSEILIALQ